jgi:hypothetical protein
VSTYVRPARELLLDALAMYDADWSVPAVTAGVLFRYGPRVQIVAANALLDARVRLDAWDVVSGGVLAADDLIVDDVTAEAIVAVFEEAVEILTERIAGRRPSVVAL